MHNKLVVTGGLLATGYIWQQYSDSALHYVSHKLNQLIDNYQQLPQPLKQYFTVPWLVGVSLGSQIFIKACGNHSPAVNFAEKTILGFGYFIPTAFGAAIVENIIANKVEYWVVKGASITTGMVVGGYTGSFIEKQTGSGLDSAANKIDLFAGLIKVTLFTIISNLIGKTAQAAIIEEEISLPSYSNATEPCTHGHLVEPAIFESSIV